MDRAAEAAPDLAEEVEFPVVASVEAEQALVAAVFQEGIFGTRVLDLAPVRRQRLVLTAARVFHTAPEPAWRKIRPVHFRR